MPRALIAPVAWRRPDGITKKQFEKTRTYNMDKGRCGSLSFASRLLAPRPK